MPVGLCVRADDSIPDSDSREMDLVCSGVTDGLAVHKALVSSLVAVTSGSTCYKWYIPME